MNVLVPHMDAGDLMGGVPAGVKLTFWREVDELPAAAEHAEVFLPPWWAKPQSIAALARMPRLRLVQMFGAGYDWIAPSLPPSVQLANLPGVNAGAVAEWVIAAILNIVRDFPGFFEDQRNRRWHQRETQELSGSNVLLIGYGAIGQRVATFLRAFNAKVIVVASRCREEIYGPENLPQFIGMADIVVLTVPLTATTYHMVDQEFLSRMRNGALLINAARGGVVDTAALVAELQAGRLRAGLDVTDPEPLPANHELWRSPGVVITPHVASVVPSFLPASYKLAGLRPMPEGVRLAGCGWGLRSEGSRP